MGKKDKLQNENQILNDETYLMYYNRLTALAITMFEWKNLPETIDARFMELMLYSKGQVVFFKDNVMGYLCLQFTISGGLNVYCLPTKVRAYAVTGYNKMLDPEQDCVLIWNNYLHTSTEIDIRNYAKRLYKMERTIDVNLEAQKTPGVLQCNENQRLIFENLYKQYEGNMPFIFADKNLDLNGLTYITTGAPFISDKVEIIKSKRWNEAMTCLGIKNSDADKKERLIADEISNSMGDVKAQQYTRLITRQEACEKINNMFGLNISVDYREGIFIEEKEEDKADPEKKEEIENE